MLHLYLQAPFAACRNFSAGWYRPTATFVTPSAIYGLLMNVAGVETRLREEDHSGNISASLMQRDLPAGRLALGVPADGSGRPPAPQVESLLQQLHNYPVGASAGMPAELSKGNKNNITPVRREFLQNVKVVIACEFGDEWESQFKNNLVGKTTDQRYGIPFLGDNQFLLDRLDVLDVADVPETHWYDRLEDSKEREPPQYTTRLTVWIDRADMSKTSSFLFAPIPHPSTTPPDTAWITFNPS